MSHPAFTPQSHPTQPLMAARAWNSLPTSVTTATSLACFKKQLKTFLITKSFPEF